MTGLSSSAQTPQSSPNWTGSSPLYNYSSLAHESKDRADPDSRSTQLDSTKEAGPNGSTLSIWSPNPDPCDPSAHLEMRWPSSPSRAELDNIVTQNTKKQYVNEGLRRHFAAQEAFPDVYIQFVEDNAQSDADNNRQIAQFEDAASFDTTVNLVNTRLEELRNAKPPWYSLSQWFSRKTTQTENKRDTTARKLPDSSESLTAPLLSARNSPSDISDSGNSIQRRDSTEEIPAQPSNLHSSISRKAEIPVEAAAVFSQSSRATGAVISAINASEGLDIHTTLAPISAVIGAQVRAVCEGSRWATVVGQLIVQTLDIRRSKKEIAALCTYINTTDHNANLRDQAGIARWYQARYDRWQSAFDLASAQFGSLVREIDHLQRQISTLEGESEIRTPTAFHKLSEMRKLLAELLPIAKLAGEQIDRLVHTPLTDSFPAISALLANDEIARCEATRARLIGIWGVPALVNITNNGTNIAYGFLGAAGAKTAAGHALLGITAFTGWGSTVLMLLGLRHTIRDYRAAVHTRDIAERVQQQFPKDEAITAIAQAQTNDQRLGRRSGLRVRQILGITYTTLNMAANLLTWLGLGALLVASILSGLGATATFAFAATAVLLATYRLLCWLYARHQIKQIDGVLLECPIQSPSTVQELALLNDSEFTTLVRTELSTLINEIHENLDSQKLELDASFETLSEIRWALLPALVEEIANADSIPKRTALEELYRLVDRTLCRTQDQTQKLLVSTDEAISKLDLGDPTRSRGIELDNPVEDHERFRALCTSETLGGGAPLVLSSFAKVRKIIHSLRKAQTLNNQISQIIETRASRAVSRAKMTLASRLARHSPEFAALMALHLGATNERGKAFLRQNLKGNTFLCGSESRVEALTSSVFSTQDEIDELDRAQRERNPLVFTCKALMCMGKYDEVILNDWERVRFPRPMRPGDENQYSENFEIEKSEFKKCMREARAEWNVDYLEQSIRNRKDNGSFVKIAQGSFSWKHQWECDSCVAATRLVISQGVRGTGALLKLWKQANDRMDADSANVSNSGLRLSDREIEQIIGAALNSGGESSMSLTSQFSAPSSSSASAPILESKDNSDGSKPEDPVAPAKAAKVKAGRPMNYLERQSRAVAYVCKELRLGK